MGSRTPDWVVTCCSISEILKWFFLATFVTNIPYPPQVFEQSLFLLYLLQFPSTSPWVTFGLNYAPPFLLPHFPTIFIRWMLNFNTARENEGGPFPSSSKSMATTWNKRISARFTIGMLFGRGRVFTEGSTFTSKTRKGSFHWPAAFMCDKSFFFLDTAIVEKMFLPYPHFLEKISFFHTYFLVKKVFLFTPIFWQSFFFSHPIWVNIISEMKVVTPTTTTRRTTLSVPWPVGFAAGKNLLSPVAASKSMSFSLFSPP